LKSSISDFGEVGQIESGSHTILSALTPNPSPLGEGSRRLLEVKTVLETGFGITPYSPSLNEG
jgi:hypothetical protein